MAKIARQYGKNRIWGDVFKSSKGSWLNLNLGFQIGTITYNIVKEKNGDLTLERTFRKADGSLGKVKVGKAFKSKTKNGKDVWNFTLGLVETWDPETKRNIVNTNDAFFLTILLLDESKQKKFKTKSGEEITKIGIVVGQIGIEVDVTPDNVEETISNEEEATEEVVKDEDIPF